MIKKRKRGQILAENIIFIVLNLIFLTILILFIYSKTDSAFLLEEKYSKQIALLIDSAKPGMIIHLNMKDAIEEADKNNQNKKNIVSVSENAIKVKLTEKGGYSYSFFNNVNVSVFYDDQKYTEEYVIIINDYN